MQNFVGLTQTSIWVQFEGMVEGQRIFVGGTLRSFSVSIFPHYSNLLSVYCIDFCIGIYLSNNKYFFKCSFHTF
jgi:hypothetical protein